ncbi:Bicarbonate transport system permease protein CmpB [Pseudovibrio axinellae]|uniref:Bicarbonate transport system permease protein CmpB n=1 Tax=Pseudovibrio axinellae TaxID=989403 RepID=A0A166BDS5_9HYPH|nr:ABC transporter permease [Pseudovibrio axinellae]KZL22163.1 Bicarbonate transport system permease protein CmpB [Pseudovibrio axinellae]SEQ52829.1 nitrate/nitrite transport system permease protein [Pseudovibrio axinellae]
MSNISQGISADGSAGKERFKAVLRKLSNLSQILGLAWFVPLFRLGAGENPKEQLAELNRTLVIPLVGVLFFLFVWGVSAPRIQTSLGAIPGPVQVWEQAGNLWDDHVREREKAEAFYARQDARNAKLEAAGQSDKVKHRKYTGKPTYLDQILTSLFTVSLGFVIATAVAVPLGIASGLSRTVNGALSPLIQIFKPVSPLAWLPIVTMIISAAYSDPWSFMPKSLLVSAVTVTLCSLWPTLINTALGVASIDKDLMNVGRVLQLSTLKTITKLVLPSSLPLIFTGLRLSLGVGWMVLIAAEMLAQNPGLGKFVWDEFQNGSSQSLAKIIVAVLTIGLVGFMLDRVMYALQSIFSHNASR